MSGLLQNVCAYTESTLLFLRLLNLRNWICDLLTIIRRNAKNLREVYVAIIATREVLLRYLFDLGLSSVFCRCVKGLSAR